MSIKRVLFALASVVISNVAVADNGFVIGASVTKVQVYETTNNSTSVWIHVNGSSRVGPNPVNPNYTCELWTHDKGVLAAALAAQMSGKKVEIHYADRGDGTYWCNVVNLSVLAN